MFVVTSLIMAVPMMGSRLDFIDAWFESTSAVTTTGLSVTATVEDKRKTFLFSRAWMQWYGGLGIVVLSLGLAIQPGLAARRARHIIQSDEADIVGGTRAHAQRILLIYCSLTVVGVAALWLAGAAWLEALLHGLAAVSTGGFSSRDNSLAAFPMAVQVVATVIAAGASISLPLYWLSGRKQLRTLVTDVQLLTLYVLCGSIAAASAFGLFLRDGSMPWTEALRHAPAERILGSDDRRLFNHEYLGIGWRLKVGADRFDGHWRRHRIHSRRLQSIYGC